mmetsp:Transcript_1069/g.1230  ORF Transcript_1069/g.1230 Transcript_1069/m.1230 type:complete len:133 (-) Transcript_1069:242-640(-)
MHVPVGTKSIGIAKFQKFYWNCQKFYWNCQKFPRELLAHSPAFPSAQQWWMLFTARCFDFFSALKPFESFLKNHLNHLVSQISIYDSRHQSVHPLFSCRKFLGQLPLCLALNSRSDQALHLLVSTHPEVHPQ